MKEIKFRAWDKEKKVMQFVGAIDWDSSEKIMSCNTETSKLYVPFGEPDFELMQFTGLTDKQGKEIYEGDIVEWEEQTPIDYNCSEYKKVNITGGIIWDNDRLGFLIENFSGKMKIPREVENIGNIYENPYLLK